MTIKAAMTGAELIGIEFTETEIPHAVYRLYDAEDALLYIGISWHPPRRMDGHAGDKDWWPLVAYGTMHMHPSEMDARKAEAEAIDLEKPLHNDVRPAVGPTVPPHGRRRGWHRSPGISWHPADPTLKPWFQAEAKRRGVPVSELLDEALAEYRDHVESLKGMAVTQSPETTPEGDPK